MMSKKRILLFIDSIGYGGAQKQFVCLCRLLKDNGYDIKVLVIYDEFDFYKPLLGDVEIMCDQVSKNSFRRLFRIPRIIKKQKADVVISFLDSQCILSCLARMFGRFKLIVSERNTTQDLDIKERIKFFLYRFADCIVPNSFSQGSFIKDNYPDLAGKVNVITNVIDLKEFYPQISKNTNAVPQIISVGRNVYQKNYLGMVEVVRLLKERGVKAHFNWYAGKYTDNYYLEVEKRISEYGLRDMITIYEPTKSIAERYRENDFFWIASYFEGFPNALCEAMACGLPVVSSNVCDNPIIAKDGENGLLTEPNDIEGMAEKLTHIIALPKDRVVEMSNANVARIKELCSEEAFINKYIRIID